MTASELALLSRNEYASVLLDGVSRENTVFNSFMALPLIGTQFDSMVISADPTAAGFLARGQGYVRGARTFVKGKVNAARVGFMINEPVSVTDEWNRSAAAAGIGGLDWLTQCAQGQLMSELALVEQQIFDGTANDALGFLGLKQICSYTSGNVLTYATSRPEAATNGAYTNSVINAGGSTANTADSIYLVRMAENGVNLRIGGENGVAGFLKMSQLKTQYGVDAADATREQPYYKSHAEGYIGLSVMGSAEAFADRKYYQFDVRRIANVTAQVGFTCTEALLDYAMEAFPDGHAPNVIYMSKRAQRQLRDSRIGQVTQFLMAPGGDAKNAQFTFSQPLPESHRGVPIIATRRISSTQAIES